MQHYIADICELKAAGEIFPYEFQMFQGGSILAIFGVALQESKEFSSLETSMKSILMF